MPVLAFVLQASVRRGICPPPLPGSLWVQAFVRTKCGFRHLSSWHLSGPNVGSGICPPGICPDQMWVQAFVLLAFVRSNSDSRHLSSWHLSDQKMPPGICPPGICPIKNCLQAFVLLAFVRP